MTDGLPTADRAYAHVKARLVDGSIPGGELLSEGSVAAELGISRTPVREAFLRLQSEGFLKLYPKRGALVVPVTLGEARAVIEARLMVETFALQTVAALDGLSTLGSELLQLVQRSDDPQHMAAVDFHTHLVEAADNPVIADLYRTLHDRSLRMAAAATRRPGDAEADSAEHLQIATALTDADLPRARDALTTHLSAILQRLGAGPHDLRHPAP